MIQQLAVGLRPENPEDIPFLRQLYYSVRKDESGYKELEPDTRALLLNQQFDLQHQHYRETYPQAWYTIITVNQNAAGRLYLAQLPDSFRVIDISLLPEYRSHGIGTQLFKNIQAQSMHSQLPIRLSVLKTEAAQNFYRKLGFQIIADKGLRHEMQWHPRKASHK